MNNFIKNFISQTLIHKNLDLVNNFHFYNHFLENKLAFLILQGYFLAYPNLMVVIKNSN